MRRLVAVVALVVLGSPLLVACGGSHSSATSRTDQPTKVIDITFHGSDVTPNGTDIDVRVGQPLEFVVTADKPGEIHVHSSPQKQELEYDKGSSTLHVKPIQAPGQVVVESHTLGKTLFTLVAR